MAEAGRSLGQPEACLRQGLALKGASGEYIYIYMPAGGVPSSLASTALGGLSAVGSGLLLCELAGGLAAVQEEPREEERAEG